MSNAPAAGHNNPPSPIELALEPFNDTLGEIEHWLDGDPITTAEQNKAVDALAKALRGIRKKVGEARDAEVRPLHEAYKAAHAEWEPIIAELKLQQELLGKCGQEFKLAETQRREAEAAVARAEARRVEEAADVAAAKAKALGSDLEASKAAVEAKQQAQEAKAAASAASRDKVKGLRTVWHYEVEDARAALGWIAANDRAALEQYIDEYARQKHREVAITGVRSWSSKEAY
jgi:hypothetical protein